MVLIYGDHESGLEVGEEEAEHEGRNDKQKEGLLSKEKITWSLKAKMKQTMQRTVSHMLVSMTVKKE